MKKDPQAKLDYGWNWAGNPDDGRAPWLAEGETISSATVTVPAGLTKESQSIADGVVTVWLSGGTDGASYMVTCHIVTNQGREDDRSLRIDVADR